MTPTLDTYVKKNGESIILYGAPKTGKTLLAGQLASDFTLHWFDLENGIQTLATQLPQEYKKNVNVIQIPDTKNSPVAANAMWKILQGVPTKLCYLHGKIFCAECQKAKLEEHTIELSKLSRKDVVVIDSGSQLSDSSWAYINMNGEEITWKTYEKWNSMLAMMLSNIQQAPYHTVFITHEVEVEMPDGSKKLAPLCATKNFSSRVAKFFGHVVYTEVRNKKFGAGSTHEYSASIIAGSRAGIALDSGKGITLKNLLTGVK